MPDKKTDANGKATIRLKDVTCLFAPPQAGLNFLVACAPINVVATPRTQVATHLTVRATLVDRGRRQIGLPARRGIMRQILHAALTACAILVGACDGVTVPASSDRDESIVSADVAPSGATKQAGTVITFDAALGELPEGVAADRHGNLYVSMPRLGEVRKIAPDGSQALLAELEPGALGPLGLAVDREGSVYAAVTSFDPASHGVWRLRTTTMVRLPGSWNITFPNAIAFAPEQDALYVTDTFRGAVWRIPRDGSAELWVEDELLRGTGVIRADGLPLGANGIAYSRQTLFVANTDKGLVARIPVQPDGSAGEPSLFAEDAALFSIDGLAADATGNLYAAVIGFHRIMRISRDGASLTPVATVAEGVDCPASIAFGRRGADRLAVFVTNYPIPACPAPGMPRAGPAVVRIPVGLPGVP
jgi:sugar lactone lactonase YvrE